MASLDALPAEIILHIHLLSTSSTLPYVSKYVHSCIRSSSTPSYRARWLLLRLAREGYGPASSSGSSATHEQDPFDSIRRGWIAAGARAPRKRLASRIKTGDADSAFLNKALKYPICDLETIRVLESLCLKALNERLQMKFKKEKMLKITSKKKKQNKHTSAFGSTSSWTAVKRHEGKEKVNEEEKEPPVVRFLPLTPRSIDIPKRLFRNLLSTPPPSSFAASTSSPAKSSAQDSPTQHDTFDNEDFPFILHLITQLQANPNSNKGYSLAKAVLARHIPLIRVLLDAGADPSIKDYMAVMLAVGRGDLEIVRLLIERHEEYDSLSYIHNSSGSVEAKGGLTAGKKRKRRGEGESGSPKKRKLEDRIQVTSDMLELAVKQGFEPLIQFFMSKGAVPSLKTLQMLHQT